MNTVTQTMLYRQAIINYANKYGVTKAAIRYKTNRQYIYRRIKKDMTERFNRLQISHINLIITPTGIRNRK